MSEAKNLREYKEKVRDYLLNVNKLSEAATNRLMKRYEDDFQECFAENWSVSGMVGGMVSNLL